MDLDLISRNAEAAENSFWFFMGIIFVLLIYLIRMIYKK